MQNIVIFLKLNNLVQVNLCQKLLFLHQLTHNMTTDCSLFMKIVSSDTCRTCCVHKLLFLICFDIQNNFGTQHVLQMLQASEKDLPVQFNPNFYVQLFYKKLLLLLHDLNPDWLPIFGNSVKYLGTSCM